MRKQVFSLLVDNNPGVLSRISGLFSRRGYSIDSITAGMTADPRYTRITVVSSGDELILSQIEKQVRKLEDVVAIKVLKPEESVCRELIMVKLRANAAQRGEIISVADIFRAKIVDVEEDSLMIELTGTQSKLEAFLNLLKDYEILGSPDFPEAAKTWSFFRNRLVRGTRQPDVRQGLSLKNRYRSVQAVCFSYILFIF